MNDYLRVCDLIEHLKEYPSDHLVLIGKFDDVEEEFVNVPLIATQPATVKMNSNGNYDVVYDASKPYNAVFLEDEL